MRAAVPWVMVALVACRSHDGIDFPQTLGLLEANRAPALEGSEEVPYPEAIVFASGKEDGRSWAHARAYVHGSPDEVFAALQRPEVLVDRREIDEYNVVWGTVPRFDVSLTLQQTVHDVVTVSYDTTWVMEVQGEDAVGIDQLAAQWDKTDGTTFIDLLAGSLVAKRVTIDITEVQMVTWLEATLRDEATLVSYLDDLHADIVASVHGEPLQGF